MVVDVEEAVDGAGWITCGWGGGVNWQVFWAVRLYPALH